LRGVSRGAAFHEEGVVPGGVLASAAGFRTVVLAVAGGGLADDDVPESAPGRARWRRFSMRRWVRTMSGKRLAERGLERRP